MSFLSSSVSSSSLSTPTGSTSPLRFHSVYPSFLPLHGIHSLYVTILEAPVILHTIEEIPLFREDSISHELVHLFHGITRAQCHLLLRGQRNLISSSAHSSVVRGHAELLVTWFFYL